MGVTVLDAGVLIALLDADDVHHPDASRALRECRRNVEELIVPASVYAEILIRPPQSGERAAAKVDAFLDRLLTTDRRWPSARSLGIPFHLSVLGAGRA
jgi:predicted nucleic acid-binding protein